MSLLYSHPYAIEIFRIISVILLLCLVFTTELALILTLLACFWKPLEHPLKYLSSRVPKNSKSMQSHPSNQSISVLSLILQNHSRKMDDFTIALP